MGCYLSSLKKYYLKMFIYYFLKKQYVELKSENIGVYCH